MMAEARSAVMRNGMGKGASAVMRVMTKPGQITLTPTIDVHEVLVHVAGDLGVREHLFLHDVTPVATAVTD